MGFLTTFANIFARTGCIALALRFNKNCDMDYLPKDPAILVSDITKAVEILEKML